MDKGGNALARTDVMLEHLRPLKVLLDARKLEDGGIGIYIKNLIRGLKEIPSVELTLLCDPDRNPSSDILEGLSVIYDRAKRYTLDEYVLMPMRLKLSDYDVFHVPHYTLPFGIKIPTVITVHDLIHVNHPQKFYYPYLARPLIKHAMKRATCIVTVSHASFQDLKKLVGQDPEVISKMHVVPNAVDDELLAETHEHAKEREEAGRGDYFLAVFSNSKPHKGLDELVQAFVELRKESSEANEPFLHKRMVLVGPGTDHIKGHNFDCEIGSANEIVALGTVSRPALRRLYSKAFALVVPSRAEGFCLPVLEAHAVGIPVIARPVPAVLELLTQHDMMCKDFSIECLKKALKAFVAKHPGPSSHMPELVREADRFRAKDTAMAMLQVYQQAVAAVGGAEKTS